MTGQLYLDSTVSFYSRASKLRIESYFNLGSKLADWRRWIATQGPILTRLSVDRAFMDAGPGSKSRLRSYDSEGKLGGQIQFGLFRGGLKIEREQAVKLRAQHIFIRRFGFHGFCSSHPPLFFLLCA